jgi:hypothetical protein
MTLRQALDRTLLLMRDEVVEAVSDEQLISALTNTRIAIVVDSANIPSHSAQSTFVTAALLMARSGHRVHLLGPDVPLVGHQPPLAGGRMITSLLQTGCDLLPGIGFCADSPADEIDLAVAIGNSKVTIPARRTISLNAGDWSGRLLPLQKATEWRAKHWPLGGLVAAALAATEAFKLPIRTFDALMKNPSRLETVFAPTSDCEFEVAPVGTSTCTDLGEFDCVSGGAIINAAIYTLTRIPGLKGHTRIIEPETTDISNLNRYMLLLRSRLGAQKARDLVHICAGTGLTVEPIEKRYQAGSPDIVALRGSVLVGADDIPTRWQVQRAKPAWLAVGATTHWSAMASFHDVDIGGGCAQCLHPTDHPMNAPIQTGAFVSFWAGLLTAAYFLRKRGAVAIDPKDQQIYLTPFRPENPVRAPVPRRPGCPTCQILAYQNRSSQPI